MDLNRFISLRKELHQNPEFSGEEANTATKIVSELKKCSPDKLVENLGGNGVLAGFFAPGSNSLKNILFRAELDAIPVSEQNDREYRSVNDGMMHGCGHDGHMAILIALASELKINRPENVHVWLLFQPAEETGEGAQRVINDPRFAGIEIDHAFALHNLPGYQENLILAGDGVFACASTGIEIEFRGISSHAAYPEQGINPSAEMAGLILEADKIFMEFRKKNRLNKAVCTYVKLGEPAYGVSPGTGKIGFTLRSPDDKTLDTAVKSLKELVNRASVSFKGVNNFRLVEPFSATVNSRKGVNIVRIAAEEAGFIAQKIESPFPWSEDFGVFRKQFPITLFGLGAGTDSPPLHSETYDFNDRLIETGFRVFWQIIKSYHQE